MISLILLIHMFCKYWPAVLCDCSTSCLLITDTKTSRNYLNIQVAVIHKGDTKLTRKSVIRMGFFSVILSNNKEK